MKTTLFFLCLSLAHLTKLYSQTDSVKADNPGWILAGIAEDGLEKWYVKSEYVSKDFEGITVWIKVENCTFNKNGVIYKNCIKKDLVVIDCTGKKEMILNIVVYNSKKQVINSTQIETFDRTWDNIVPESIGEIVVNKVCELFNK